MKLILFFTIAAILVYGGSVGAQDSNLGTMRSEDLQMKAKFDYEKRNRKQPEQAQKQGQKEVPATKPAVPAEDPPMNAEATVSHPTSAAPASPIATLGAEKNLVCKHGGEVRNLYIEKKGQGCELFYTKMGTTKSQARQNYGTKVCDSVLESMKATLEKTGFVCEPKTN